MILVLEKIESYKVYKNELIGHKNMIEIAMRRNSLI